MASASRARPVEGFYEELFPDNPSEDFSDFSDDGANDALLDSSDDEYVVEKGEDAKEPIPDR